MECFYLQLILKSDPYVLKSQLILLCFQVWASKALAHLERLHFPFPTKIQKSRKFKSIQTANVRPYHRESERDGRELEASWFFS